VDTSSELSSLLKERTKELQKVMSESLASFKAFNDQLPIGLKMLANQGWYISAGSPIVDGVKFAIEITKGNNVKVDSYMAKFYEKEAKDIIKRLCSQFPGRVAILTEALQAHRKGMYFSSTSLFLSNADGLCDGFLFTGKNGKANLKKLLERKSSLDYFLSVIVDTNAIDTAHHKMRNYPSDLNRHGVMHGLDVDYGTKVNSLKALSLLAFIGDFVYKRF
jgi:hypothetical protein